jgi:hypothetical protein
MGANLIAHALGGCKSGRGWAARCPTHDDCTPTLSISEADDGKVLVRCHTARAKLRLSGNGPPPANSGAALFAGGKTFRRGSNLVLPAIRQMPMRECPRDIPDSCGVDDGLPPSQPPARKGSSQLLRRGDRATKRDWRPQREL